MDLEKLESLAEKFRAHLKTEEGKAEARAWFEKWEYDKLKGLDRISRMLDPLSKEELEKNGLKSSLNGKRNGKK